MAKLCVPWALLGLFILVSHSLTLTPSSTSICPAIVARQYSILILMSHRCHFKLVSTTVHLFLWLQITNMPLSSDLCPYLAVKYNLINFEISFKGSTVHAGLSFSTWLEPPLLDNMKLCMSPNYKLNRRFGIVSSLFSSQYTRSLVVRTRHQCSRWRLYLQRFWQFR